MLMVVLTKKEQERRVAPDEFLDNFKENSKTSQKTLKIGILLILSLKKSQKKWGRGSRFMRFYNFPIQGLC